ncbi:hypothetical protein HTZ77_04785 [Nonomuraea sp. SMC257]|uniref:GIY-YIG nuclease family protein n=1 Tax=Nonomuraea montanisoli TaxID=2741721 RepID=A0A7Y6M232_9ACTN|nr:hypothetical protein [Nonomuraea montanisoli]NUW30739.1 hypothetical protein [Nonomuraea montanisoli]
MSTGGTVYLLHFDRPYKHARHYIGWTSGDLSRRLRQHRNGTGARLMQVITKEGIDFVVARIWDGGRNLERSLKNRGGASRSCPLCGVVPRVTGWDQPADEHTTTADDITPHVVAATCACNRIIRIAASLLASASITCSECHQPITAHLHDAQGDHHALVV